MPGKTSGIFVFKEFMLIKEVLLFAKKIRFTTL